MLAVFCQIHLDDIEENVRALLTLYIQFDKEIFHRRLHLSVYKYKEGIRD